MNVNTAAGWTAATFALWLILATMAEFPATADLSVALATAIAIGVTGIHGPGAFDELNKLIGRGG